MMNDRSQEEDTIVSKDRYYVIVEVVNYYDVKNEQLPLLLEKGKQATVGDYIRLFKEHYNLNTEIKAFAPYMEFKVTDPQPKGTRLLKVLRFTKDFTYRPITRI